MWALVPPHPASSPTCSPAGPVCPASPKWCLLEGVFPASPEGTLVMATASSVFAPPRQAASAPPSQQSIRPFLLPTARAGMRMTARRPTLHRHTSTRTKHCTRSTPIPHHCTWRPYPICVSLPCVGVAAPTSQRPSVRGPRGHAGTDRPSQPRPDRTRGPVRPNSRRTAESALLSADVRLPPGSPPMPPDARARPGRQLHRAPYGPPLRLPRSNDAGPVPCAPLGISHGYLTAGRS